MCSSSKPGKIPAGDVQSGNLPYYKWSTPSLISSGIAFLGKNVRSQTEPEAPTLSLGERVVWLNDEDPEFGIVRWIGRIPYICSDWTIGVEFDNPIGIGSGSFQGRQYFVTKPKHACFLPILGLIKAEEFQTGCLREKEYYSKSKNSPGGKIWQKSGFRQCQQCGHNQSTQKKIMEERPHCHHCAYFMKDSQDHATTSPGPESSDGGDEKYTDASVVQKSQVSSLFKLLEEAIANGQHKRAAALARELALRKVSCSLSKIREMKDKTCEYPITLNLFIEDKSSHRGPLPLRVLPSMTLKMLKKKVEAVFKFPIQVQRWILGKSLATNDGATLASYGIETEGCPVFLYLVSLCSKDKEGQPHTTLPEIEVCPFITHPKVGLCLLPGPSEYKASDELPQMGFYTSDSDSDHPIINHGNEEMADNESDKESNDSDTLEGKMCSNCGSSSAEVKCKKCTSAGSEVVTSAVKELLEEPEDDLDHSDNNEKILQDYHKLIELDEQDLVPNMDAFECPVCFMIIEKGKGVVLRDCLHLFCKDCLAGAIHHTEIAMVKCLFRNEEYSCDSQLQDREIKALVSVEEYERFLQRSIAAAENGADNSFHCKTPDCKGWCFYEDNVNAFLCPVCGQTNCLTCRAIHEGRNCRQYQDELEFQAAGSEEAKKTKEFLDTMLIQGDAMRCPKCQVIVMKRWGCDWLKCSVCQTEICWVTKGPRWGQGGKGDTSGGCGCGVNGIRCHPKCNYCH